MVLTSKGEIHCCQDKQIVVWHKEKIYNKLVLSLLNI